jgi:hypothetical protein
LESIFDRQKGCRFSDEKIDSEDILKQLQQNEKENFSITESSSQKKHFPNLYAIGSIIIK